MTKMEPGKVVRAITAASLALVALSCSKKAAETGWKAEIEVVDGVKTVRNPETPKSSRT
jgi:hypothetical protein